MFSIYFPIFTCHLKKVLALVLAFACAFTMFAGAAFTDQADIKVDSDVVDTLVSLGVVNGYDDGSFKPNGTVTRAQDVDHEWRQRQCQCLRLPADQVYRSADRSLGTGLCTLPAEHRHHRW